MKSLIFVISLILIFFAASCGTNKYNPYLLYPTEKDTEWIQFARKKEYRKGIESLSMRMKDSTYRNPHINQLDLSRMFAMNSNYANAIKHRLIAEKLVKNSKNGPWIWHHLGTIAFFEKDKNTLDSLINMPWSKYGKYDANLKTDLLSLQKMFKKKYQKATIFKY